MIAKGIGSMVGNRQILIWRSRSMFRDDLRMVYAGHRDLPDDFGWFIRAAFWGWRMCNRDWRRRKIHRIQHRDEFEVLIIQTSVVSIDANHTGNGEQQRIGCHGKKD